MRKPMIQSDKCINCGLCVEDCLRTVLERRDGKICVGEAPCFACGHCVAICPRNAITLTGMERQEILEYAPETFRVPAENLLNFMRFRRSMRHFTSQDVSDEDLHMLIEAGRYAPTGSNCQENQFIVIRGQMDAIIRKTLKTLQDLSFSMDENPALAPFIRYRERWGKLYDTYVTTGHDPLFYHAPCVICVVARNSDVSTRIVDAGLASENIELMANALGLGVCFVGFLTIAAELDESMKQALGLKEKDKLVTALAIGHPKNKYCRTVNREKADVIFL